MGHELRTPLNAILAFTGTVLMGLAGPLSDEQTRQLRTVQSSGRHLLSLINVPRDLATTESGREQLTIELIDCTVLLDEVADGLRSLADEKNIRLLVEAGDGIEIHTDLRALKQILMNLTSNAIEFTDRGEIALELSRRRNDAGCMVVFALRDTGRGITHEDQEQLCDPFARIGGLRGHLDAGAGLGLYICQTLATRLVVE
jgi:two-component system, sensor histidine kinase and response regulator